MPIIASIRYIFRAPIVTHRLLKGLLHMRPLLHITFPSVASANTPALGIALTLSIFSPFDMAVSPYTCIAGLAGPLWPRSLEYSVMKCHWDLRRAYALVRHVHHQEATLLIGRGLGRVLQVYVVQPRYNEWLLMTAWASMPEAL